MEFEKCLRVWRKRIAPKGHFSTVHSFRFESSVCNGHTEMVFYIKQWVTLFILPTKPNICLLKCSSGTGLFCTMKLTPYFRCTAQISNLIDVYILYDSSVLMADLLSKTLLKRWFNNPSRNKSDCFESLSGSVRQWITAAFAYGKKCFLMHLTRPYGAESSFHRSLVIWVEWMRFIWTTESAECGSKSVELHRRQRKKNTFLFLFESILLVSLEFLYDFVQISSTISWLALDFIDICRLHSISAWRRKNVQRALEFQMRTEKKREN